MAVGSLGHIGLGKETTFGTPVAATKYVPFVNESIAASVEQVVSESNRAIYDESASYKGGETYAGDLVFDANPNILGVFLRSLLGAPVSTQPDSVGNPTVWSHVFTPVQAQFSADCDLPPYTIEVHRDAASAWQYTSGVVNQMQLQIGVAQKIMRVTASIIAKAGAAITKTTPSLEATSPFLFNQLAVTLAAVSNATIHDIAITVNNALEGVMTLNSTNLISKIKRNGKRVVNLQMTLDFGSALTEYTNFINQTEQALNLTFTGPTISSTYKYSLLLEMPKVRYSAYPINIGGPGRLMVQVAASVKYDATYALRATLQNTETSY